MANSDIIKRLLDLCSAYEAGRISATRLESELKHHISALEKIGSTETTKSRDFSARLVRASFTDSDFPGEDPAEVLNELRVWISSLPA